MEFDVKCINKELNNIINNKKKYGNEVILYALATLELISNTKTTNVISYKFIKFLTHIRNYLDCSIDFDFLSYLHTYQKNVTINDNITSESTSSSFSDSYSEDIQSKINGMIESDSFILQELVEKESNSLDKDIYGPIDKKTIKLIKRLFNILDVDKDGYISALDTIHILEIIKKYPLIFENNFDDTVVELLTSDENKKIDFYSFYKNLY